MSRRDFDIPILPQEIISKPPYFPNMSSSTTFRSGAAVSTKNAPAPLPVFSQAIVANNIVHVSGHVGMDPSTGKLEEGVGAQTVSKSSLVYRGRESF